MGNRICKKKGNDSSEYYIRDIKGNVLAIYLNINDSITLLSRHIYGGARLGQQLPALKLKTAMSWATIADTGLIGLVRGLKQYELCNHLGNVLATITDRHLQRFTDTSAVSYYDADIINAQNYYSFGALMPGRQWSLNKDKTTYKDSCITCGALKQYLRTLFTYSSINNISVDTISLLSSLNSKFNACGNWTYWSKKLYTTCKLWDSIPHFTAPSSGDDAHILYNYTSSYTIGTSNFTVEGWVWRDSIAGASEPTIISKEHQNPMSGEIGGFRLYLNTSGNVKFTVGDAQSIPNPPGHQATITTTSTIPFRKWKHIVAIRNGNNPNNWSIYVDNTVATVTVTGPTLPSGNIEQGSNDAISIGAGIISGNNNAWHGRLNRVRMYKSALSVPNISSAYNSGCGTPTAVTTSDLDAILNSTTLVEQAHSQVGSIITGGTTGAVSFFTHWRDSLCTEMDSMTLWCTSVISHAAKSTPRYGFNNMERNDDLYGEGGCYLFKFRVEDARLGRFFSYDPLAFKLPFNSPYSFAENSPIKYIELEGLEKADASEFAQAKKVITDMREKISKKEIPDKTVVEGLDLSTALNQIENNLTDKDGTNYNECSDWGCGPTAAMDVKINYQPLSYTKMTIDLLLTGKTKNGSGAEISLPEEVKKGCSGYGDLQVDYIFGAAVRSTLNTIKKWDPDNKLIAGTFPGEMKKMLSLMGVNTQYSTYWGGQSKDDIVKMQDAIKNNLLPIVFENHIITHQEKDDGIWGLLGIHYIVIHSLELTDKNKLTVKYSDYGSEQLPMEMTIDDFLKGMKGYWIPVTKK